MSNEKQADFSAVSASVDSTAPVQPKADFSAVTASVDSTAEVAAEQSYTVQAGDSLSKIAQHFYGDGAAWKQIFEANSDQLSDPNKIFPGQSLRIPAKS